MQQVMSVKENFLGHVVEIIDKLMNQNNLYQERLIRSEITQRIVELLGKISIEEIQVISDDDLTNRIDDMMMIGAVAGLLNDFTPEEMQIFDEAVEGR